METDRRMDDDRLGGRDPGPRTIDDDIARRLGQDLRDREVHCVSGPRVSDAHPDLTVSDAYAIQRAYVAARLEQGSRIVGRKVGATNPVIQRLFNQNQPDYGVLFEEMVLHDGARVATAGLVQPRVETEVAFVLGRPLEGPGVTAARVLLSTEALVPCFEIIDSRIHNWDFLIVDTIADNGSSARVVLGNDVRLPDGIDLRLIGAVLERNGEVVDTGAGAAVIGHPAASVAWLANTLAIHGDRLEERDLVLSGALTTAVPAEAGDHFQASFGGLGRVSCRFV